MSMRRITRRDALKVFSAGALASSLSACSTMGQKSVGKVVVDHVGSDVLDAPASAQRVGLPPFGGQVSERRSEGATLGVDLRPHDLPVHLALRHIVRVAD